MANKIGGRFIWDKSGKVRLGVVLVLIFLFLLIPLVVSALNVKESYLVGNDLRIDLRGKGNYVAKLITPSKTLLKEGSEDLFLYQLNELGSYELKFKFDSGSESYSFNVVEEIVEEEGTSFIPPSTEVSHPPGVGEGNETGEIKEEENRKKPQELDVLNVVGEIRVGKSVKWARKINVENVSEMKISVPSNFNNLSIFEEGFEKNFSVESNGGGSRRIMGLFSSEGKKEIILKNVSQDLEIFYETPAPVKIEEYFGERNKKVVVSSSDDLHYENVLSYTEVEELVGINKKDLIKIYWEEEGRNLNFQAYDNNGNGLIDYLEWIVPHLSTQTFNVSIDILNVQSYPVVGGNWTIKFNTLGFADLYIRAINETTFGYVFPDDLKFLDLVCENNSVDYAWTNESIFVSNYSCNDTGFESSLVMTEGKHYLEFQFGEEFGYAQNDATDPTFQTCSNFWGFDCGAMPELGDNTFDACGNSAGSSSDEHVNEIHLNGTSFHPGESVRVICEFDPYSAATEEYIYLYNGSWRQIYAGNAVSGTIHNVSVIFNAPSNLGTSWVRCIADYNGENDECGSGSWYDNDDLNFNVVNFDYIPSPILNSSDGTNQSSQNLNCYDNLSNGEGEEVNVSIIWYRNGVFNFSVDYNNSYSDGNLFNAVLNLGNTSGGDNWSCGMRAYYRSTFTEWVNSSQLNILGISPLINLTVVYPTQNNVYVAQNEFFNVTLNITCFQGTCGTINVTLDPIQETFNDFETGTEGFEHFALNEKEDEWHISTESKHDGIQSWKCGDDSTGDYSIYSDSILITPTYDLEDNHTFSFYHYLRTEAGYDGGILEYSVDGGSWSKFDNFVSGGYNDQYQEYNGGPNLVNGEDIWSGSQGGASTFQQVVTNLSGISGENITFRFHFFADDSVIQEGWYIDSVNFTTEIPGMDKGIIPVGAGFPFYANTSSNPLTSNFLGEGDSQLITFFVNATGELDSKYYFFAYANLTSAPAIGDVTEKWNITISINQELPDINIDYPTLGTINDATPILDINLTGDAKNLWYNINGGANQTLCSNCDGSNDEILYLRETSYVVNVYASNSMGEINSKSISFNVDLNNNYYDSFNDASSVYSSNNIEILNGNITLDLKEEEIINENFDDAGSWSLIGGQWQINTAKELAQRQDASDSLAIYNVLEINNETDYNVSFRLYSTDNDYSGFLFGYENSSNYYRCQVRQQSAIDAEIVQVSGGTETIISTTSDSATYNLNFWNTFLLEIKNHTVSCYVNGALATRAIDVYFPVGYFGIYNDVNDETRYDNFTAVITGGKKMGLFTSYSVDLIDTITKFINITWNEYTNNNNNSLTVEVSADDGAHWYGATKNGGLSSVARGDNFVYRVFFNVEDLSLISLLDLNISWSNNIDPPPSIFIEGIDLPIEQDFTPVLNITLDSDAASLLMSIDGKPNETICENCVGSQIFPVVLEEGSQIIIFYANNSGGQYSTNSTSFTVDFNKNHYDNFSDNSSIGDTVGAIWDGENMIFYASTSNSSAVNNWDANDQTGDSTWANSGRTIYSYRNIMEASSINASGDFVRINFVSGTDGALGINNPTICERSGATSNCVGGTWTSLRFGGSNSYVIPSFSFVYSDWLEYDIDETKDYLITFYVDGTNTAISYLSPTSVMVYSVSGVDYSGNENWSSLSPVSENLMYGVNGMDVKSTILGGTANFTSHVMNASQEINGISYAGWTETGVAANNNISLQISVDNGWNWNTISNGGSLSGFTSGSNLVYRALFSADSVVNISMSDINITWESPPTITIFYPGTYVYNTPIIQMNYSIDYASGVSLDTCWYSLNLGVSNTTINCNQNITGISSVDGENTWFVYANDSSGAVGFKSVTFSVDTSAPVITFINQTDSEGNIVDANNPLYEGDSLTLNVDVSDNSVDNVWVVIWENVIGGVQKAVVFFSNLFGDSWGGEIDTDESFGESYNYTIYANDTTGLTDSYDGTFDILKLVLNLNLNPLISIGNENIFMTGYLNLSNGTVVSNNAINFWFEDVLIPFENLTNHGTSVNVLNFNEDKIKIVSGYDNVTYSSGEFTLDGTNTSGSFTGILDAGARVDWDKVIWSSVANPCFGIVDYQEGDSNFYSGTEDSYVTSLNQNTNYGSSTFLTVDSSPDTERSLVKFDDIIGFGKNKIPYGSTISSATFRLTVSDTGDNPNFYEFLESWDEDDATYLYRTDSDLWSSAGFATTPSINPISIGYMGTATAGTKALDVTTTLQRWVDREIENNGFAIQPIGSGNVLFRSKEYPTQSERPRLSATFSSSDCTGVLVYIRTSNDKLSWSDWAEIFNGGNITDSFGLSRYLEYKVEMGAYNSSYDPRLQELSFNYTGAFTDATGFFNYSFVSTDVFGSYDLNVSSGYKTAKANVKNILGVQSGVAPQVVLVRPINTTWISGSSWNLTYNATDLNGDFSLALLILDGFSNVTNSSVIVSGENNLTVTGLIGGYHNWSVNLSDVASTDGSETWDFYVDLVNPEIELISPSNNSDYSVGVINLSFRPTDNLAEILSCDVVLDGSTIHTGVSVSNDTVINVSSGAIGGGAHYWNVTCYDGSLRNVVSDTWRFTVTDTPPTVSLVSPVDNYVDADGNLVFTYLPNDGSGIDHCDLLINGGINQTNSSINLGVNNFFNISGFSEGFYDWSVACYDLSLTSDVAANRTFGVDLNSPSIILVNPVNESVSSWGIVNFEFNVTDTIDSNLSCSVYVDGMVDSNLFVNSGVISNVDSSLLYDGPRYWYVNCTDDSNHFGISEIRVVDVKEPPLVVLNNTNGTSQQGNAFMVQFTPNDNTDIDSCTIYLNDVANESVASGISLGGINNLEIENLVDGRYQYYVNCSDGAGNFGVSEENTMYLDNIAPGIIIYLPDGEDLYSSNITFEFEVIDSLSENVTCNLSVDSVIVDSNFSLENSTNASRFVSGILDGYREWSVTCWDDALNINSTSVFNFTKYTAPGVNLISPANNSWLNVGDFNFTYLPQDDGGFLKTELIVNGAIYITNQSVVTSGVNNYFEVNLVDGIYNWGVNVTDITSMIGESVFWKVYVDTLAPQVDFVYPLNGTIVGDNNVSFTFDITENLDDSISCNLSIDGDVEFTGELINGTNIVYVPLTDGNHNWNMVCVDEAGNGNSSVVVNFTVFAPPKIELESPANNFMTTNETIIFSYTPIDALGLDSCGIYVDGFLEDTDNGVIKNVVNNFTLGGISEGKHNWTVECTDTDFNINQSVVRNFTRDLTSPSIILDIPLNDSGIDFNLGSVTFRWKAVDALDRFPRCDLIVDGSVEANDKLVTNDTFTTELVSGLSLGEHYWNVSCWDIVNNINFSETRMFNFSYPDFFVNSSLIVLNNSNLHEGEAVLVNATIENIGYVDSTNVMVQFYQGNPFSGGVQFGNNQSVSVGKGGSLVVSEIYFPDIGMNEIYVIVDKFDDFAEFNENNNVGNHNVSVGAWQFFYGDMDSESNFALAGGGELVTWDITSFEEGSIFVSDSESIISWGDLIALGKNLVDGDVGNDFGEVDGLLFMTGFADSISNLYLGDEEMFSVFGNFVDEVPVTNSTDNTNFVTGILWDGDDDSGDGEFSVADSEDLIFVTKLNENAVGAYGTYDYEMRVPATLRSYAGAGSEVVFYVEVF